MNTFNVFIDGVLREVKVGILERGLNLVSFRTLLWFIFAVDIVLIAKNDMSMVSAFVKVCR